MYFSPTRLLQGWCTRQAAEGAAGLKPRLNIQKDRYNGTLKSLLRNCAVPPGLGSTLRLDPALRLRLRAEL